MGCVTSEYGNREREREGVRGRESGRGRGRERERKRESVTAQAYNIIIKNIIKHFNISFTHNVDSQL